MASRSRIIRPSVAIAALIGAIAVPAAASAMQVGGANIQASADKPVLQVQTPDQALAQDAAQYARLHAVDAAEALRRVRAQQASVAETERIRAQYRGRLAGISIEHDPEFRIAVLLTGSEPVASRLVTAGDTQVPIVFRTGARATHDQLVAALRRNQAMISAEVPGARGMGIDGRTGKLVLLIRSDLAEASELPAAELMLEALTGVPSQIRLASAEPRNLTIEGGARVEGMDPRNGRNYACTTGFAVVNGERTGLVTAAHCPDQLDYVRTNGERLPLTFLGEWGARYQDVQLHVSSLPVAPFFLVDRQTGLSRPLTAQRLRTSTRPGETVCRRGESSGYSCSTIDLTDFAPPGDLCGGPCEPVWVTVAGPSCRSGDSGGPVFSGTTAFGIVKGGSYDRTGGCNFYFYMSTDYLPEGWSLLFQHDVRPQPVAVLQPAAVTPGVLSQ